MRIVIDGRMLYWTGVGRYLQRLLEQLQELDHENHYLVLVRTADWGRFEPRASNFEKVRADIDPYTVGEQLRLVGLIRSLAPDLVHFTSPNAPILYRGRRIVTVHDLTLLDFDTSRGTGIKRWVRGLKRIPFRFVLRTSIRKSVHILTVTNYVAKEIERRFAVAPGRVTTTLLGSDPLTAAPGSLERFGLDDAPFLLYWGNYYPYKNVGSTIEALAKIQDELPHLRLVLAGNPDTYGTALMERARQLGVGHRVHFVGFVSDAELVGLCRAARLFVLPSLSEGFGLTGLEAMAQGLPVLAARASCLPEVYGEAAEYFDPTNVAEQARMIVDLVNDEQKLKKMSSLGRKHASTFTWQKTAAETLAVYKKAASKR